MKKRIVQMNIKIVQMDIKIVEMNKTIVQMNNSSNGSSSNGIASNLILMFQMFEVEASVTMDTSADREGYVIGTTEAWLYQRWFVFPRTSGGFPARASVRGRKSWQSWEENGL